MAKIPRNLADDGRDAWSTGNGLGHGGGRSFDGGSGPGRLAHNGPTVRSSGLTVLGKEEAQFTQAKIKEIGQLEVTGPQGAREATPRK